MARKSRQTPRLPGALSPDAAVAAFNRGEVVYLFLPNVISLLGMTAEEFLPYLQSGDITAHEDGAGIVTVRSDDLIDWMVRHGRHLVTRSS